MNSKQKKHLLEQLDKKLKKAKSDLDKYDQKVSVERCKYTGFIEGLEMAISYAEIEPTKDA